MVNWIRKIEQLKCKIAELKAEVEVLQRQDLVKAELIGELTLKNKELSNYICFLEEENKRLVSELESRPVVWMLRSKYTGLLEMSGDYPDIYCLAHAKQFNPNSYSLEPYAREGGKHELVND